MRFADRLLLQAGLAISFLALASVASAQTTTSQLGFIKLQAGDPLQIIYNGQIVGGPEYIGAFQFQVNGTGPAVDTFFVSPPNFYSSQELNTPFQATATTSSFSSQQTSGIGLAGAIVDASDSLAVSGNKETALQIAVEEAMFGSQVSFRASSSVLAQATTFYNDGLALKSGTYTEYTVPSNGFDAIAAGNGKVPSPVPEPSGFAVLGVGAVGVLCKRRNRSA